MYLISVVLLLFVLPAASVVIEALLRGSPDLVFLIGKWFVLWGAGVRLFLAGLRQVVQPQFTAQSIFGLTDRAADGIVREIGFANLSMGTLGLLSLFQAGWLVPAAIVGGLYYGLAGLGHAFSKSRNVKEQTALISDLLMFLLLATFVASRAL